MKQLLSLPIACLIAILSVGQVNQRNIPDYQSSRVLEVLKGKTNRGIERNESYAISKIQPSITTQLDKEVKQQLDSTIQESALNPYYYQRKIYNYDTRGNVIRERTNETYVNIKKFNDFKYEYLYDSFGNEAQAITYKWDQDQNQYVGTQRVDKLFDSKGYMTQEFGYNWNVSQWIASYKHEYLLNSNGKDTLSIGCVWDQKAGQWINNSKTEKSYDAQGKPTLTICFRWDESISQWINSYKDESVYDAQGNEIIFTMYRWNNEYNKWDNDTRMEYTFNAQGKLTKRIGYTVNSYGHLRVLDRWDYTYGLDGNTVEIIGSWDRLGSGHLYTDTKIVEEYDVYGYCIHSKRYRFIEPNQWELKDYMDRYYSVIENSAISNPANVIETFPNPATEHITFNIAESAQPAIIELYDMQGKKIISRILASNHRVGVAQLKSGIYFYKLIQNKKVFKGKVCVK